MVNETENKEKSPTSYALGITYAIISCLFESSTYLVTKNVLNQKGQHIKHEENLLPRGLLFLLTSILYISFNKVGVFGLEKKTLILLHLVGLVGTLYIYCFNVALYSLSVGDTHVLSYLSIVTTVIIEKMFRKKDVSSWKIVFSMGILVGGVFVAQPPYIFDPEFSQGHSEHFSKTSSSTNASLLSQDSSVPSSILSSRIVGLVSIFVGFNLFAVMTILMKMAEGTPTAFFIFHQGLWKVLLFPLLQLILPSAGRLFSSELKDFLQYDLIYHIITSVLILLCWIFEILALQIVSPVVSLVLRGASIVFDYSGQTIIDQTVPNTLAWAGIFIIQAAVIVVTAEDTIKKVFNKMKIKKIDGTHELYPIIEK